MEWAEQTVVLPSKESQYPGHYSIKNSPCFRDMINDFANPAIQQITTVCSTQTGKTLAEQICALYAIAENPGRLVWVMAREDDVKDLIEERLKPIILASPELAKHVSGRKSDWTKGKISLNGMTIHIAWAGSEAAVQSWPCQYIVMDELSSWKLLAKAAHPVKSAKQRTIAQPYSKVLAVSTPKYPDDMIWQELVKSDHRRCMVPCPTCGKYQTFEFNRDRLRVPKGVRDPEEIKIKQLATYHCLHCEAEITERDRVRICLPNHVWAPKGCGVDDDGNLVGDPPLTTHHGYHLSAFYSVFPQVTFSRIMAEFFEATAGKDLQSFYNYWLGLPWEESEEAPQVGAVKTCQTEQPEGVVPNEAMVLTAGVDLGEHDFHYAVRAWGYGGKSWLVQAGRVPDFPQIEQVLCEREWPMADGRRMRVSSVLMDEGYRTDEVTGFCRKWFGFVHPCKGIYPMDGPIEVRSPEKRGGRWSKTAAAGLSLIRVNTDYFKTKLYRLIRDGGSAGDESWHVHKNPRDDYCRHMVSEKKVLEKGARGVPKKVWKKISANHFLDCEVYAFGAAEYLGLPYRLFGPAPEEQETETASAPVPEGFEAVEDYSDWTEGYDE